MFSTLCPAASSARPPASAHRTDYPLLVAGVTSVENRVPASTIVLLNQGFPVLLNSQNSTLVASANFRKGRVAAFGGERMVTKCCRPSPRRRSQAASDPGFDRLLLNVMDWAAHYGWKARKAVLRVESEAFVPMAR